MFAGFSEKMLRSKFFSSVKLVEKIKEMTYSQPKQQYLIGELQCAYLCNAPNFFQLTRLENFLNALNKS